MMPTEDTILALKAQYPDRTLHLVEADFGEESLHFVMTGPSKEEYRRFTGEIMAARDHKGAEAEKLEAFRFAVEKTAVALIKWPDRDDVRKEFERRPAMLDKFSDEIRQAAGSEVEYRTKKL